jgi:sigma-B regulation protein RsbU (phosphoserine phosphatase)
MVRALVEELKPVSKSPGQFLTKLNCDLYAILKHTGTPLLTTAFYLVADCQTGTMLYANAGHPKPLHLQRSAGRVLALSNQIGKAQPALGLLEDTVYQSSEVKLAQHDLIMLFTDGLYEVESPSEELYSQALLLNGVQRRLQLPPARLFDEILEEIRHFSHAEAGFGDDVCLVGMELGAQGGNQ